MSIDKKVMYIHFLCDDEEIRLQFLKIYDDLMTDNSPTNSFRIEMVKYKRACDDFRIIAQPFDNCWRHILQNAHMMIYANCVWCISYSVLDSVEKTIPWIAKELFRQ